MLTSIHSTSVRASERTNCVHCVKYRPNKLNLNGISLNILVIYSMLSFMPSTVWTQLRLANKLFIPFHARHTQLQRQRQTQNETQWMPAINHIVVVLVLPLLFFIFSEHFNRLRRSSFTPSFNQDGFKIVVEESNNDEETEVPTTSKKSTPRDSLDIESPVNPYLLSPWRDPPRKHSLPSQQVTDG